MLTVDAVTRMLYPCKRILIIDDDPALGQALSSVLGQSGYDVTVANTGGEGLRKLIEGEPYDLLLLDVILPDLDGWSILSRLRASPVTARVPIIMLTAMTEENNEIELLAAGADDYLTKPVSFDKLLAHIKAICRRAALQSINPLTGLPGNRPVEQFLQMCAKETERFWAAAHIDIDNFKAYNDRYGFLRGDEVLKATAGILSTASDSFKDDAFIGNIGGDDFFLGINKNVPRADEAAMSETRQALERIVKEFDHLKRDFYTKDDFERGYVEAESRRGGLERYPLMALSIAAVTNTRRLFQHPLEIGNTLASVKRKAKLQTGGVVCFDQRRR